MPRLMSNRRRLLIGLTGGYGSGKSTVSALLRKRGVKVVDADRLAHEALLPGKETYRRVVKSFGPEILGPGRRVSRRRLAEIVFKNPQARRRLEKIIHPYVIARQMDAARKARGVLVWDVPLLFETGLHKRVDRTAVVWAPESVRRARLARKGVSPDDFRRRDRAQWPLSRKRRLADDVIDNGGSISQTTDQLKGFLEIWRNGI